MNILYAVRLFSGLESSVLNACWRPTGVPTIYRILERLDVLADSPHLLLTAKDGHTGYHATENRHVRMQGLKHSVRVLAGAGRFRWAPRRLAAALRELTQAAIIIGIWLRHRPQVMYLDHANVWTAGILARLVPGKVVFRVMGVYPAMRSALTGRRLADRILRWCYRAPYACVICTQDGSGIEPWLAQAIAPGVARYELINGVDPAPTVDVVDPRIRDIPGDRVVVLWVGKIETAKGIETFAEAFLAARARHPGTFHALIIGTGSKLDWLRGRLADVMADVTIIDRLPHAQVLVAQQRADIYVSLNRLGNLSNANLEAMYGGQCMVFPRSQPALGIDLVTDRLLSDDDCIRIDSADDINGLVEALLRLAVDPDERHRRRRATAAAARRFLGSWEQRIDAEIMILHAVAQRRPLPPP